MTKDDRDYALVPLGSRKYPGLVAVIDLQFIELVNQHRWYPEPRHNTFYARTKSKLDVKMHNLVTGLSNVDHIDGNGLNNRQSNLRPATNIENLRNQVLRHNNTSGYKGVSWNKKDRKWRAQITINRVKHLLGSYDDPRQAAIAYDRAARKAFGEFGRYNFPRSNERGVR